MARQRGWPAELHHGPVLVRPLRRRDVRVWCEVRRRNLEWLAPWESTLPGGPLEIPGEPTATTFQAMRRALARQAGMGTALPFVIVYAGRLVGQVTVSGLIRGSLSSATIGYWIDEQVAGRGITPLAVALVADHCFTRVGLHRVELNVRPENDRSRRVATKLGFREEGLRLRYLHIDGGWRDHVCYALTVEESGGGVLRRFVSTGRTTPPVSGDRKPDE